MLADFTWVILLCTAFFGAACAAAFNWQLQIFARKQAAHDRVIMDAERFCDELMTHATAYWSGNSDGERSKSVKLLARKIDAYVLLISQYVHQHFPHNAKIGDAMSEVNREVTGGDFGEVGGQPKEIRFGDNLPKTRSGKIMRRLLRALAAGEEITQDTTTLENPAILEQLKGE